jgi:hypothetical protein
MGTPEKILLLQLYSNGDCLYATAVARQIKLDFPGCRLTWAIADFCKDIIKGNPDVDEVMVIGGLRRNDVTAFRKLKRRFRREKKRGLWQQVFVTHNMDSNQAYYDGTIRGMILRAYQRPVTVPLQPILVLDEAENKKVAQFAEQNKLGGFKNVILWEYAPQSGQTVLDFNFVMQLSRRITKIPSTAVILSSARRFEPGDRVFDASVLSVRENAALTHYCNLLIGCSSGITWLSTSTAAKFLPMVQLLNPDTSFLNAPSTDFKRFGIDATHLAEITDITEENVYQCICTILEKGFAAARLQYDQPVPIQFKTTRIIVYNMLCYLQFGAILRHCRINVSLYGWRGKFFGQLFLGILTFPFKLLRNTWKKKIRG